MEIAIKKAEPLDLVAVLELQKRAYAAEAVLNSDPNIPPMTQTLDELQAEAQSKTVLKAERAGRLVGSVRGYVDGPVGYIGRLMVEPQLQGQGIGTQLMSAIEQTLQAPRLEVFTGSKSLRNIQWYQRLGYTPNRTEEAGTYTLVYLSKERNKA